MNRKPGFIPIVIAASIAVALLIGGVTYGVTNSKRNKIIKDQELKIDQLSQDLEDLKTQLSSEELSTPSVPSVPSTPSSPKPSTPSAKPTTPTTPAAPATPVQPANMKTWSGKIKSVFGGKGTLYSLSFQYPNNIEFLQNDETHSYYGNAMGGISLSNDIHMYIGQRYTDSLTAQSTDSIFSWYYGRHWPYRRIDSSGVKMMNVGGKSAAQFKHGEVDKNGKMDNPDKITTYIFLNNEALLHVDAPLSVESAYQQILSSMKF